MFLHYNMSTYINESWAHTGLDVNTFNPTTSLAADAQQWAATAKAAGMKYGVLTTKHHDGFALWDSTGGTYDIASTTWYNDPANQNYHQDIVQDFVNSFRAQGLGVDLYFSMWDQMAGIGSPYYANDPHPTLLNSSQATTYVENQIHQLLTNYGQIDALWIDGWSWRSDVSSLISYNTIYNYVKSISPNTLLIDNNPSSHSLSTSDIVEYEVGPQPPASNTLPSEYCTTMRDDMRWFYDTANDNVYRSANVVGSQIHAVNARGSNYLLNVPPDTSGRIPSGAVQNLMAIKANLDAPNPDLALGKSASQSSTWNNNPSGFGANLATDGNPDNFSHSGTNDYNPWWEMDLGKTTLIGEIDLLNRKGYCGRLRDITVQILAADGHTVVYTSPVLNPNDVLGWGDPTDYTHGPDPLRVNFGSGVTGEFIRVSRAPATGYATDSTGNTYLLTLGDVGVYAPVPARNASLTWIGTSSTTWVDNVNVPNFTPWTSTASPAGDYFTAGDSVTFSNSASVTSVTLSGTLAPASVAVTGTNNFTFIGNGSISGSTGLTIVGPGSLTLSGTNTYTGITTVNGGTLIVTNYHAIADGAGLNVGDPSRLSLLPAAVVPPPPVAAVPEPDTLLIAAVGLACGAIYRLMNKRAFIFMIAFANATLVAAHARAAADDLPMEVLPLPAASKESLTDNTSRACIMANPDWHTWCPSAIRDDDGRYHMFHSRWPRNASFSGWLVQSEIARAIADRPEGPYLFVESALSNRESRPWNGVTAHNPKIEHFDGKFYLYFCATHGETDESKLLEICHTVVKHPKRMTIRNNLRTGVAVAASLNGPWQVSDKPIVEPADPV
jgi:autotransporter-associated beta strand protein